jgi:hypothetical protein
MELMRRKTLPQGLLGQAIDYALKRWEALTHFVEDGRLETDNNLTSPQRPVPPNASRMNAAVFMGLREQRLTEDSAAQ